MVFPSMKAKPVYKYIMDNNLEWLKYEFERLNACVENIRTDIQLIHIEITKLKVKAGVWGFLAGAIPVLITIGLSILTK